MRLSSHTHGNQLDIMFHGIAILILNAVVLTAADEECPDHYMRFSSKHSFCQPANTSCNIVAFFPTSSEIQTILQLHNAYRSRVASGQEKLPSASDMMEMEWDDELALVAQKYAAQCLYQHDCPDCRRVRNFGVGQNIAKQVNTGVQTTLQPDWQFAVSIWYNEIEDFSTDEICNFHSPTDGKEYRHFSQLCWAKAYRIGCGYVLYKEGPFGKEVLSRLYICNYGPGGNVYESCVYQQGEPCSGCPENTCCGSTCGGNVYPSLCRRTDDVAPLYSTEEGNIFYCDFLKATDCDHYILGDPNWVIQPTLDGNYMGVTLEGGGSTTLVFRKNIVPVSDTICVSIEYRIGPDTDGQEAASEAQAIFTQPSSGFSFSQPLPSYDGLLRHQFSVFKLALGWKGEAQVKFTFSVPPGKPKQFFNMQSLKATDGQCS